jgi:thioredoxin reductase
MSESRYEYVIVGAGPAGLQLGYFLSQSARSYVIIEAGDSPGAFFKKFPRHRTLISANKIHTGYDDNERNLRWDWNSLISHREELLFKHYSRKYFPAADELVRYLSDYAQQLNLNVRYRARVERISRKGEFLLQVAGGDMFRAKRLIMATGVSKPYVPDIAGIEHAELYADASIDPEEFANQRVLILGKGNSAFEVADNVVGTASRIHVCSPTALTLAWKSKFVGHLRAVNNNFIDTYQLKLQNVVLDAKVVRIEKREKELLVTFHYSHAGDEIETMGYDRVIACTGFRFDASIFDEACRPELAIMGRFPVQTSSFESVNIKDLFFAGTLMQQRDFKKKQSGFIHGFRHNIQSLHRMLEERYHGVPWPCRQVAATPAMMAKAVLARANRSPGLWQQTGFLCDVMARAPDGRSFRYYEDVATDFVKDSHFGQCDDYYVITLEFGNDIINASPDPLAIARIHKDDVEHAFLSTGIHPIVRCFSCGRMVAEHHVLEDIIPEWDEEKVHLLPLERFFEHHLERPAAGAAKTA